MISEDTSMTQLNITRRRIIRMVATGAGLVASASSGTFVASATAQMAAQNVCSDPGRLAGAGTGAGSQIFWSGGGTKYFLRLSLGLASIRTF